MSGSICLVDDEPSILNTLSSILEDEGYQVSLAKSGVEALKLIRAEPPDLIMLDIWMPEMDGLETLKQMRQQYPNLMVIMMSGHGSVETAVKATKLGAYDYLEKPLDLEKVTILVRNALHQRNLEEENLNLR
ncbi:MAG: response regulator, partial [Nitrospirales bacterium]